jgi:hypothetical protein
MRDEEREDPTPMQKSIRRKKRRIFSNSRFLPVGGLHDLLAEKQNKNQMLEVGL